MEWISRLIDIIQLPTRYAAWIALASVIFLFMPDTWLAKLRVDQLVDDYGSIIGLVLIGSGSLVGINVLHWLWNTSQHWYEKRKLIKKVKSTISNLDRHEKAVLREFFMEGQNTVMLPLDQPVVAGLYHRGILEEASLRGRRTRGRTMFPMQLDPLIRQYLTLETLGIPTDEEAAVEES